MTKDIITSVIILLSLIAFALWSIAPNIKESVVDVSLAIEKLSAEIRRVRESIDGLQKETAKLRIQATKDKPDDHKVEEIVRCKDCKYMTEHYDADGNVPYWTCSEWDSGTDYDGFCHYAERRTDE